MDPTDFKPRAGDSTPGKRGNLNSAWLNQGQVQIYRSCRGSRSKVLRGSVAVLSAVSQLSASVSGGCGVFPVSHGLVRARSGGGLRYKLFQTSLGLN